MEVKTKKISGKYDAPVVSTRDHLLTGDIPSTMRLYEAYAHEEQGIASIEDISLAQASTESIFHLVRHHHHPEELGRQCLRIDICMNRQTTASRSMPRTA